MKAFTKTITEPGILLTFDDFHIAEWLAARPIFARYQARATFFVCDFDRLTPEQIVGIQTLQTDGHAIGCHSLRHSKAAEYATEHGLEKYLEDDVSPAQELMQNAGFSPTGFAYPCSNHNDETDRALLKRFRYLRVGINGREFQTSPRFEALLVPIDTLTTRRCLPSLGIDSNGPISDTTIRTVLERTAAENACTVFYAHNIAAESKFHHLAPKRLETILTWAKELSLNCYTYDDLP